MTVPEYLRKNLIR